MFTLNMLSSATGCLCFYKVTFLWYATEIIRILEIKVYFPHISRTCWTVMTSRTSCKMNVLWLNFCVHQTDIRFLLLRATFLVRLWYVSVKYHSIQDNRRYITPKNENKYYISSFKHWWKWKAHNTEAFEQHQLKNGIFGQWLSAT